MPKFITHEAIAANTLNIGYSTGSGPTLPWQEVLVNREETLELLVDRMQSDYEGIQIKQRKPWGQKEVEARFRHS